MWSLFTGSRSRSFGLALNKNNQKHEAQQLVSPGSSLSPWPLKPLLTVHIVGGSFRTKQEEPQRVKISRSTQILESRVIDRVAGLDIQGDGLARQRLHEDLHATTQAQHQVKGGLLLDVVIRESSSIL